MTLTQSRDFREFAPAGKYWRHAPVVKFSETPCKAGLPYDGLGSHTRSVLLELGYDDENIERLAKTMVISMADLEASKAELD